MEVYNHNDHTIIHSDAMAGLKAIADQSIDLIFADPPYNIGKKFQRPC